MRRALQRCSASVPRSFSSLTSASGSGTTQCLRRIDMTRFAVSRTAQVSSIRSLHQSSIRRQEAASTPDAADNTTEAIPITRFDELGTRNIIHPNIVRTLIHEMGLESMTEVQNRTINEALKGQDIIAQAKTGTGKTLAFLLPILQRIINVDPSLAERQGRGRRGPRTTADDIRGLIISPTRELAEQIAEEAKKLCKNTGVIVQTAVGGTQKSAGLRAIQRDGCHLLVGTPGRLKDLLTDPYSKVEAPDLSAFVLDEADRLLDQGFWPEIQEIMRLLPTPAEKDRQTLMFSATVPQEVVSIVRSTLKPGFNFVKCVRDDEEPTHARIPQKSVLLNGLENCIPSLIELCQRGVDEAREQGGRPFKAIVYFNSTAEVTLAASTLMGLQTSGQQSPDGSGGRAQHPWHPARVLEIHAKLSQAQRTHAADAFRRSESGILLSSDVTARGMDFPNVTHVIQIGLPTSREQYIHRIGRTGRAGKEGEGWIMLNRIESTEARNRLRDLPLIIDSSLEIPKMDLTQPAEVPANAGRILGMYQNAVKRVSIREKAKVYLAQLGIYQWYSRKAELIEMMNRLSRFGWGLSTPPEIPQGLAAKLRVDRVPGVRIGTPQFDSERGGRGGGMGRGPSGDRGGDRYGGGGRGGFDGGRGGADGYRAPRSNYDGGRGGGRGDYDGGRSNYGGGRSNYGGGRPQRTNDAFEY